MSCACSFGPNADDLQLFSTVHQVLGAVAVGLVAENSRVVHPLPCGSRCPIVSVFDAAISAPSLLASRLVRERDVWSLSAQDFYKEYKSVQQEASVA